MKILRNIFHTLQNINRGVVAILMLASAFMSCQFDEPYSPYTSKATLSTKIITYGATTINGTTRGDSKYSWEISVTKGGSFCKPQSNIGAVGKEFYLKFQANEDDESRIAEICIRYSNGYTNTFTVTQLAKTAHPEYDRPWAEQPDLKEMDGLIYKTYYTTLSDGDYVRNFSVCYDTEKLCSRWVAYPAHSIYTEGKNYQVGEKNNSGRTNAWAFDDAESRYSPSTDYNRAYTITSVYMEDIDAYNTSTEPIIPHSKQADIRYNKGFGWDWARGHMLPSANRYNTWKTNAQTCYATNIMVQDYKFNGKSWATLENYERSNMCPDTLFVVTGTLFEDNKTISREGRTIGVPSHTYKLFLRTRNGNTGKHIINITSADEVKSIGFVFQNDSIVGAKTSLRDAVVSVSELEQRAGYIFFRNLNPAIADEVKQQKNLNDWGL